MIRHIQIFHSERKKKEICKSIGRASFKVVERIKFSEVLIVFKW